MEQQTLDVIVQPATVRGAGRIKQLAYADLAENVTHFLDAVRSLFGTVESNDDRFNVDEIEVYAEIDARGKLALLGTGGEAGAKGGIKFVFRRREPVAGGPP
jgi:hypothetical protein